jgi:hypothetical protein
MMPSGQCPNCGGGCYQGESFCGEECKQEFKKYLESEDAEYFESQDAQHPEGQDAQHPEGRG